MKRALLVSEILGDCLLPLLGFLWWGWDLYFILLYLLFDYLIRIAFALVRPSTRDLQILLRPLLFFFSFAILSHFYMTLTDTTWRFTTGLYAFFWYEDLWIPQGFILIPLLVYTESSRKRMDQLLQIDAKASFRKLGNRLLYLSIVFMLMSLLLLAFSWSESSEIWFFISALLAYILFENRAAFLAP